MYKSAYKTSSAVYVMLCDYFMSYKSMRVCINAHNRDVFTIILNASRCYHVCFGVITQQRSGEKESKACHFVLFDYSLALFILLIWSSKMLFFLSVVFFCFVFYFFVGGRLRGFGPQTMFVPVSVFSCVCVCSCPYCRAQCGSIACFSP